MKGLVSPIGITGGGTTVICGSPRPALGNSQDTLVLTTKNSILSEGLDIQYGVMRD